MPLIQEKLVLVVPQTHPLAELDELYLKDTMSYSFVYFDKSSGLRVYLDQLMNQLKLTPLISIEVEEDHTMLGFVSYDYGIAIMPDIPLIAAYPVKKIAILDQRPERSIYLAKRRDEYLSPAAERFYTFCLEQKDQLI